MIFPLGSKIDSYRVYKADIYEAVNLSGKRTDFDYPTFTPSLVEKRVVVINYNHYFIPLKHFTKFVSRLSLAAALKRNKYYCDERFLTTEPNDELPGKVLYVANLEQVFTDDKKYSIAQLQNLQSVYKAASEKAKREVFIIDPNCL